MERVEIPVEDAMCNDPEWCVYILIVQKYYDKVVGVVIRSNKAFCPQREDEGTQEGRIWNAELKLKEMLGMHIP